MIVVADASVLVTMLTDFTDSGRAVTEWLQQLAGDDPEVFTIANFTQLEVVSAISRQVRAQHLEPDAADRAIRLFQQLPSQRRTISLPMARRILELRNNFSAYDAAYLALAEALQSETSRPDVVVATLDAKLAGAPPNVLLTQVELYSQAV